MSSPKAVAQIDLDVPTRTIRVEIAADDETLRLMIEGLQAVRNGDSQGYALITKSLREPGSAALLVRRVSIAPAALRFTPDGVCENDS